MLRQLVQQIRDLTPGFQQLLTGWAVLQMRSQSIIAVDGVQAVIDQGLFNVFTAVHCFPHGLSPEMGA